MKIIKTHKIKVLEDPIRFVDYCVGKFEMLPSRSSVKKAIKKGVLKLNKDVCEYGRYLKLGDEIQFVEIEGEIAKEFKLKLEVVFEDDYLAVIHKPAGYVVSGNKFQTITNALNFNLQDSTQTDAIKPKPIHRLDGPTSGLLIIAKTAAMIKEMGQMLQRKEIQKTYHAVVIGVLEGSGKIDTPIDTQESLTEYHSLNVLPSLRNESTTLVKLHPKTGRTHQLRRHLSSIGHPIVGDKSYGIEGKVLLHKGLFLTSTGVQFKHPVTSEDIIVEIPIPEKFHTFMEREAERWKKFKE